MSQLDYAKETVELPHGATIGLFPGGEIKVEDNEGRVRSISGPQAVLWMYYTIKGEFPTAPRAHVPTTPEEIESNRAALEEIENKAQERDQIVSMPDGTKMRLTPLTIPR